MSSASVYFGRIKRGAILNVMVSVLSSFGVGFASYYFQDQGLEFYKIMLIWAISPLASLPVVYFVNKWDTKKFLKLGVLTYVGMVLPLLFYSPFSFILFGIFNGLLLGLFWVSFNSVFFGKSSKNQHAKDSSLYFIFPALVAVILPPIGALTIDSFGYRVVFFITILAALVPFFYIRGKYFDYKETISFKEADKAFNNIRLISFFEGALHFFQAQFIPVYALLFLKTEYEFGGLLSYLALISLSVSFILSYVSDRYNKRVQILYPLLTVMAFLILLIPSISSLSVFILVIGLYAVLDNLSLPIHFAVHIDLGTKDTGFWRASEFYGNIGRTIVFTVSALFLYFGNQWLPFVIFAVMTTAFPFIIQRRLNRQKLTSATSAA